MRSSNPYNRRYLDLLGKKVVTFDGAMGTNLQLLDLSAEQFGGEQTNGCNDYLVISFPQAVESVHRSFLDVGVDVIETCTFRSNRITLAEYGIEHRVVEINKTAATMARSLADEYSRGGQLRLVAGSVGPSGKLPSMNDPELSNITFDELADVFREQAVGLIEGGVDLLLIETSQDILEVKAIINGFQQAFVETGISVPIQAQVTLDTTGRMLLGSDISAVLTILDGLPIHAIGLNCSTGPDYMREPLRYLTSSAHYPVSCIPNAGLPLNVEGKAVYPLEPKPFADTMTEYVDKFGVNIVGGCCGTTPEHLRMLVDELSGKAQAVRSITSIPALASSTQSVPMRQEPPPFLIGERLNTQGSQVFKQMILDEKFEDIVTLAQKQVDSGAHGLDLCTALTERADEGKLMVRLIKTLSNAVQAPFIIDSTEPLVIEGALKTAPGRCLVNSINMEAGRTKFDRIVKLARAHNAAVIALTIDEEGMAKTAARKLEVAKRIYHLAVNELGMRAEDLVFDVLTFTLATGDPEYSTSAIETINGIKLIKKNLPGVLTSLGVSNVSFGLPAAVRPVINSVMLYHCVKAGLDMAIVNPAHITPYSDIGEKDRTIAEDLIFNRGSDPLKSLISHFEKSTLVPEKKANSIKEIEALSTEERLHWRIVHRVKEDVEKDIDAIINRETKKSRSEVAVDILNNTLLPAMKEVGDKFGSGELILPFVLQSAEVMKRAVSHLENYLERKKGISKGVLVLATVYGDVHDIGKNLVKTILVNNGYDVIDLGKQVPAETIIATAQAENATAIGLSALLVSTSKQMPLIVNELHRRGASIPVLIGGAAINRRFGRRILQTETNEFYPGGVYYCKDAFEGLSVMDKLVNNDERKILNDSVVREAMIELNRGTETQDAKPVFDQTIALPPAAKIPSPPFWGVKVVKSMPLEMVFEHLSLNELYRLSWGAKNTHGEAWTKLKAEFDERLHLMRNDALKTPWLRPQAVYGYFPAQRDLNELIIYDPATVSSDRPLEMARFTFPRQSNNDRLCLADYFVDRHSGKMDLVAFQVVTVGNEATQYIDRLQAGGDYSKAYFAHGLAVQMAEATADYLHQHIRRELNLEAGQGKRYSWGYPAIPELMDHQKVFDLLPAEEQLGMKLTDAYQLIPEQSTAAIIIHHPGAKYFNIGTTRLDQLIGA